MMNKIIVAGLLIGSSVLLNGCMETFFANDPEPERVIVQPLPRTTIKTTERRVESGVNGSMPSMNRRASTNETALKGVNGPAVVQTTQENGTTTTSTSPQPQPAPRAVVDHSNRTTVVPNVAPSLGE